VAWTFAALIVLYWVFRYTLWFTWLPFEVRYMRRLALTVFARVQAFSTSWFNDAFAGVTVRNITRGMGALDELSGGVAYAVFPDLHDHHRHGHLHGCQWIRHAGAVFHAVFRSVYGGHRRDFLKIVAPANRRANEAIQNWAAWWPMRLPATRRSKPLGLKRRNRRP